MGTHPLKKFREKQAPRLTQQQLAKMLGVSRTTIARWETGTRKVDRDILQDVSAKTDISPRELRPDLAELLGAA